MITIKPAAELPLVLSFDGSVLEVFKLSSSSRVHASLIESLELKTDKKGKHALDINVTGSYVINVNTVDEGAVPKVTRLIEEVQKAKAGFRFD